MSKAIVIFLLLSGLFIYMYHLAKKSSECELKGGELIIDRFSMPYCINKKAFIE